MNHTAEKIKSKYSLLTYLEKRGLQFTRQGAENRTLCWLHDDHHPSMDVNDKLGKYICRSCGKSGSVIDAMMHFEELTLPQVLDKYGEVKVQVLPAKPAPKPTGKPTVAAQYIYQNEIGEEIYRVIRYTPKDFRQFHKENGKWIRNIEGITRVLYHLPEVMNADRVWIVEGEKDVDSLRDLGIVATCNPGGANKWKEGYSHYLEGKEIIIVPDNDDVGKKHADQVRESVAPLAKWLKQVKIPLPFKDITEYISSGGDIDKLVADSPKLYKGIELPIYSEAEREELARKQAKLGDKGKLDLSKWLRGFEMNGVLFPGDLAVLIGATGSGKSACAQNIAQIARPLTVLFFQLELTVEQMRYREVGISTRRTALAVRAEYNGEVYGAVGEHDHIYYWSGSMLTPKLLEEYIVNSELKIGEKPDLVVVDYLQLMGLEGSHSRYEKFSTIAESLKRIAKSTNTIILVVSQTQRPAGGGDTVIGLHSAKESGSVESSATLVFGIERTQANPAYTEIVIVKYTRGSGGGRIVCYLKPSLLIEERRTE